MAIGNTSYNSYEVVRDISIDYTQNLYLKAQATKRVARQRKIYNNVPPVYILWVK